MTKRKWTKEEIEEYRKIQGAFFYCNKEDSNFLVPKLYGFGVTINLANPIFWVLILIIIVAIIVRKFFG